MVELCTCRTILSVSYISYIALLYPFTSTFVWTVSSGLLLILLFVLLQAHTCSYHRECAIDARDLSSILVGAGLLISLIAFGLQYGYFTTNCYLNECCESRWIPSNITGLSLQLHRKIYGQPLAIGAIAKLLRGHVDGQPHKATVLSLHGIPGTGKSYVSKVVADQMYSKGMNSKYVHYISATKDFPHERLLDDYKDKLRELIHTSVKECPRSFFIIDEMDKLLPGLIDTLYPFIDVNEHVEGTDFRHSLFFFLGNTAGEKFAEQVNRAYANGSDRRKLSFKDMEEITRNSSWTEENGLYRSNIAKSNLITAYVPFLPLERKHVKKCIVDGLFARGFYEFEYQVDNETVDAIADELLYFPNDTKLFSTTGCKRVMGKIDLVMQKEINTD